MRRLTLIVSIRHVVDLTIIRRILAGFRISIYVYLSHIPLLFLRIFLVSTCRLPKLLFFNINTFYVDLLILIIILHILFLLICFPSSFFLNFFLLKFIFIGGLRETFSFPVDFFASTFACTGIAYIHVLAIFMIVVV